MGRVKHPSLFTFNPLVASICWGYAVINILLGLGMAVFYQTRIPITGVDFMSYQAWGGVFVLLGLAAFYSLLTDNWKLTRQLQAAGLLVKAFWGVALIIRCIVAPQTILVTVIWFFFAYVQAAVYYFFPRLEDV